jgi:iron complex transport system ATP-binding protein
MVIEIKGLTCKYGNKSVFENLSLHVRHHLSILGSNGAGKSTFAKALCHLIDFQGSIRLDGQEITSHKSLAKALTYIPPKLDVYEPYISVEEFILLGRYPHKGPFDDYTKEDHDITLAQIERLGITHLKEQRLHSLSSGEQQLVLTAQALTQQSKTIIFDEPTANLDPKNARSIAHTIQKLKAEHRIIVITHDLRLAAFLNTPLLFIANQTATLYEDNELFFSSLSTHYGVAFEGLEVRYD